MYESTSHPARPANAANDPAQIVVRCLTPRPPEFLLF
jgi:hypothetical protein